MNQWISWQHMWFLSFASLCLWLVTKRLYKAPQFLRAMQWGKMIILAPPPTWLFCLSSISSSAKKRGLAGHQAHASEVEILFRLGKQRLAALLHLHYITLGKPNMHILPLKLKTKSTNLFDVVYRTRHTKVTLPPAVSQCCCLSPILGQHILEAAGRPKPRQ